MSTMNVYVMTEVYGYDDSEVTHVFRSLDAAELWINKHYHITKQEIGERPYINNCVGYYWTDDDVQIMVQRFGVRLDK